MTTEMKTGVVQGVSKFGINVDGTWYNPDKKTKPTFNTVRKGDTVTLELNGGTTWFTKLAGGTGSAGEAPVPSKTSYNAHSSVQMARSTALKAATEFVVKFAPDFVVAEQELERLVDKFTAMILGTEEKKDA